MTKQNLLNLTAPEYETVKIYDVIQNLSIETNETFSLWLLRIARSACPLGEHLSNCNVIPLILRPDEKWGIPKTRRETTYETSWRDNYLTYQDSSGGRSGGHSRLEHYHEDWNLKESVLSWVCNEYAYPPSDDRVFKGIDINFINEGIVLYRPDFREWCLASSYPLPEFWFPKLKGQIPTETPTETKGQALANHRHKPTAPSPAAINEIINIIADKELQGEDWHQMNEIDHWLKNNPESKTTRVRLKKVVNAELKKHNIPPKMHRPPRK